MLEGPGVAEDEVAGRRTRPDPHYEDSLHEQVDKSCYNDHEWSFAVPAVPMSAHLSNGKGMLALTN